MSCYYPWIKNVASTVWKSLCQFLSSSLFLRINNKKKKESCPFTNVSHKKTIRDCLSLPKIAPGCPRLPQPYRDRGGHRNWGTGVGGWGGGGLQDSKQQGHPPRTLGGRPGSRSWRSKRKRREKEQRRNVLGWQGTKTEKHLPNSWDTGQEGTLPWGLQRPHLHSQDPGPRRSWAGPTKHVKVLNATGLYI